MALKNSQAFSVDRIVCEANGCNNFTVRGSVARYVHSVWQLNVCRECQSFHAHAFQKVRDEHLGAVWIERRSEMAREVSKPCHAASRTREHEPSESIHVRTLAHWQKKPGVRPGRKTAIAAVREVGEWYADQVGAALLSEHASPCILARKSNPRRAATKRDTVSADPVG